MFSNILERSLISYDSRVVVVQLLFCNGLLNSDTLKILSVDFLNHTSLSLRAVVQMQVYMQLNMHYLISV